MVERKSKNVLHTGFKSEKKPHVDLIIELQIMRNVSNLKDLKYVLNTHFMFTVKVNRKHMRGQME